MAKRQDNRNRSGNRFDVRLTAGRAKYLVRIEFRSDRFKFVPFWIYASQIFDILALVELAPMWPSAQAHHDIFEEIEDRELDGLIHEPVGVEENRIGANVWAEIGLLRALKKFHFHNAARVQFREI
jgi:hypothetical protein